MASNDKWEVEKMCRLCNKNVEVKGVITNTRVLFSSVKTEKPLSDRFKDIGVFLQCRPGIYSGRICKACYNVLVRVEEAISTLNKWKHKVGTETDDGGSGREEWDRDTPTETPRKKKLCKSLNPESRVSTTEVYINYPSKTNAEKHKCDSDISGVINNLAKSNFTTAARLMVQHAGLMAALKPVMEDIIDKECQRLCHQRNGFVLWKSSPEELKEFSLHNLKKDLEHMAPFMFSMICTISGQQTNQACAAAAIALRGRENHVSAFAYYINSVLQYGGAKKVVFEHLSRMGITTTHANAVLKQQAMSQICGEDLHKLIAQREATATAQESIEETNASFQSQSETEMASFPSPHLSEISESELSDLGLGSDHRQNLLTPVSGLIGNNLAIQSDIKLEPLWEPF